MNRFTFWIITKMMTLSHRILYKYNDDYKKWRNSEFIKTRDEARKRIAEAYHVTPVKMHVYPSLYNSDIPVFHQGGFIHADKIIDLSTIKEEKPNAILRLHRINEEEES